MAKNLNLDNFLTISSIQIEGHIIQKPKKLLGPFLRKI